MNQAASTPADTLAEELQTSEALLALLKEEQAHLINADVDALHETTDKKSRLITRMTELALQRHTKLAAAGFDASEKGMKAWIETAIAATQNSSVQKNWDALINAVKSAQDYNRSNGMLIGQHLGRTQTALHALHGVPESGTLYGPNGQATGNSGARKVIVG